MRLFMGAFPRGRWRFSRLVFGMGQEAGDGAAAVEPSLAAAMTCSAVTASMRAGHACTSAMVWPVASEAPYQRASEAWLSCA